MRITAKQLRGIIAEEVGRVLREGGLGSSDDELARISGRALAELQDGEDPIEVGMYVVDACKKSGVVGVDEVEEEVYAVDRRFGAKLAQAIDRLRDMIDEG